MFGEIVFLMGGSREEHSTDNDEQENAVYGRFLCFIHVCREGKSERMSCRLTTPKKSSTTSKQTISGQPRNVIYEDFMHFTIRYIDDVLLKHGNGKS